MRCRWLRAKSFGRDVARCAGQGSELIFGEPGTVGETEIQQAQFAVITQQEIFRFDVAMQNLPAMQHPDCSQQAFGQVVPLSQWQRAGAVVKLGERRSRVFAHHVVQMLTLASGMDLGEMPSGHALEKPLLRQQRLRSLRIVVQATWQGFQ
ncbi:hypothetical protein D3C85_1302050 [compost metagenome]